MTALPPTPEWLAFPAAQPAAAPTGEDSNGTTAVEPIPFAPEGPQPLLREVPPGDPYPVGALGPLRAAVEEVQGMTQAPVAIPAQSALSVASLAVQGFADVETLGGPRPTSLYALTVAQSGERKSSCDAPFLAALRAFEREQDKEWQADSASWKNANLIHASERDHILAGLKKAMGETRDAARADLDALKEPLRPPLPNRTTTEPTFEGLTKLFAEGLPSLGIFSDEGGQFLGGHAMNADNRTKTLAALNKLWQGDPIQRTRAGDGSITLHGRRLAVHLMVQPTVASEFMADPKATGTGFLPRFLIAQPPSTIGTRLSASARLGGAAVGAFGARLREVLETPLPMDDQTRALSPRLLPLSAEARVLLEGFSDAIEADQAPGRDLAHVTGFASKAAEQAARIAGVLTLWGDLHAPAVGPEMMADAIKLADFYLSEAARLADGATISAETARAEALRRWLVGTWAHEDVTVREVVQNGPNALRETKAARATMQVLEQHGWLARLDPGAEVRGAPRKEAWRIVRGAGHAV